MGGHRRYSVSQRDNTGEKRGRRRRRADTGGSSLLFSTLEMVFIILLSLSISLSLKTFLFESFNIPSGSMENTLRINDRIIVDKLSMWFNHMPSRGDIVVFQDPGGWLTASEKSSSVIKQPFKTFEKILVFLGIVPNTQEGFLVKRIIGVGGDTVQCCDQSNRLLVNGKPIEENYIKLPSYSDRAHTPHAPITFSVKVPEHYLWVMGDNRYDSCDSLCHIGDVSHGFVPEATVVGKVVYIIWPIKHMKKL